VVWVRFPTEAVFFLLFTQKKTVASPVFGRIAQWIERLTSDQDVVGSIPTVVAASFGISSKKTLVDTWVSLCEYPPSTNAERQQGLLV
jgi:hypothetical protein